MPSPDDLNLARDVVAQGVCQTAEVEECLAVLHQSEQLGKLESLGNLLVQRGFLTRSQLTRLTQSGNNAQKQAEPATLRLGPYELLLKLGEGGMGAVYKANDTRNGKIVALKVLPRSKAKDEMFLKRFEMEARAMFELDHPNIVHGYDVCNSDGYHYLVIEFVQGYDLCALLEQRGRFTETEAIGILEQMAKALDHIHSEHMIHRDIKPENILVGEDGIAKLTDMGLTIDDPVHGRQNRLTQTGIAMGTPFYLSPEQIKGESDVDIRSDIYALGATAYEMVTGRPPFEGDTPAVVMLKHLNEYVPSPHDLDRTISFNFCHLLERMMAKDPFHRYQTPYELLQDIRRVIRGKQPVGIRPPAGRSSIARPELHQQSQRFQRVVPLVNPAPPDSSVSKKTPSSDVIPAASRGNSSRSPSSNVELAVASSAPAQPRPPGEPEETDSSIKRRPPPKTRLKKLDSSPAPHATGVKTKAGAGTNQSPKASLIRRVMQLPLWLRVSVAVVVIGGAAVLAYVYIFDEKHANIPPTEPGRQKTHLKTSEK